MKKIRVGKWKRKEEEKKNSKKLNKKLAKKSTRESIRRREEERREGGVGRQPVFTKQLFRARFVWMRSCRQLGEQSKRWEKKKGREREEEKRKTRRDARGGAAASTAYFNKVLCGRRAYKDVHTTHTRGSVHPERASPYPSKRARVGPGFDQALSTALWWRPTETRRPVDQESAGGCLSCLFWACLFSCPFSPG